MKLLNGIEYLTMNEACKELQVVRSTIYTWVKQDRIKGYKYGKFTLFSKEEIKRFLSELPDAKDWKKKK